MDELLERHAQQLREIDERLDKIETGSLGGDDSSRRLYETWKAVHSLRLDMARMIDVAQAESDAF